MKTKSINQFIIGLCVSCGLAVAFTSCESGEPEFDDYEGGTTVYFPYQYPVRTIRLCPDEGNTTLDLAHQCQILATFGGSYNGSDGSVQVAVDNNLVNRLYFADGVSPVKAMPAHYYSLSTTDLAFNGTFNGRTTVQLTDAFFADPDAVKATYVIPLVMTGQSGFTRILTGKQTEGLSGSRCDESVWDVKPMDYVLYCVKYQNKYSGWWLTNGTTSTADIEKASTVQVTTKALNQSIYQVSFQSKYWKTDLNPATNAMELMEKDTILVADLQLSFDGSENCNITSLTPAVTATGNGSWSENGEKKSWGNKDRNAMDLNYNVDFGVDEKGIARTFSKNERLVWQRSGLVPAEEFAPIYK